MLKNAKKESRLYSCLVEDPLPTAAISCVYPELTVTTEPSFSGRVGFRIEGDAERIKEAFQALSDNQPIGCRTLIDRIKELRTEMFRCKAAQGPRHA